MLHPRRSVPRPQDGDDVEARVAVRDLVRGSPSVREPADPSGLHVVDRLGRLAEVGARAGLHLAHHEATAAVERYFYANGRAPSTLEQAGFALDDPAHAVQNVTVDPDNGMVRVFPSDLNFRGKAIAFTPRLNENKRVEWQCGSDEIPVQLLPPSCRN